MRAAIFNRITRGLINLVAFANRNTSPRLAKSFVRRVKSTGQFDFRTSRDFHSEIAVLKNFRQGFPELRENFRESQVSGEKSIDTVGTKFWL